MNTMGKTRRREEKERWQGYGRAAAKRSTDSREQLEAAREETGDSSKHAAEDGDGLRMLPQPGRQPAR